MTERQYSEEEVAAIFDLASKVQSGGPRHMRSGDGMTLAGLQEIGREVGIPPEIVAQAARSLDAGGRETSRSLIGLPIGVGNSVDLGRQLSDAEWERFVGDLRETFDARGKIQSDGTFRQWTNSRLQVLVEPTPTGHRVRFGTYNRTAAGYMGIGAAMIAVAGFAAVFVANSGGTAAGKAAGLAYLAIAGVLTFAWGALRLPRWFRTRQRQFKELIDRLMSPNG